MPRPSTALTREIRSIKSSFNRLARSFGRIAPLLVATPAATAAARSMTEVRGVRRKPRLTAEQRRALKLQGKYMGTMRGLSPAQRTRIKKIRVKRGIQAAINAARKLAST